MNLYIKWRSKNVLNVSEIIADYIDFLYDDFEDVSHRKIMNLHSIFFKKTSLCNFVIFVPLLATQRPSQCRTSFFLNTFCYHNQVCIYLIALKQVLIVPLSQSLDKMLPDILTVLKCSLSKDFLGFPGRILTACRRSHSNGIQLSPSSCCRNRLLTACVCRETCLEHC